jgi:curved DNA-binding protein CbpA
VNLYETLGVAPEATKDEIKKAYRSKAQQHHPDKGGDKDVFQQVQLAYDVLSDPARREKYNKTGSTRPGHARDDGIRAEAMQGLTKILAEIIQQTDVDHTDILERARTKVSGHLKEMDAEQAKLIKIKKRHLSAARRTKAKAGENVAQAMINSVLDVITKALKQVGTNMKILQKMQEILDSHEYEVDPKQEQPLWPHQQHIADSFFQILASSTKRR